MRMHWQQFSPAEKEALLRHFVLHQPQEPVSPEKVWREMQKTHFLSCVSAVGGAAVIDFGPSRPGKLGGVAVSEDITEGIYIAALRAAGVDLDDGSPKKARPARAAK